MGGQDVDPNYEGKYPGKYLAYAKLINKGERCASRVFSEGGQVHSGVPSCVPCLCAARSIDVGEVEDRSDKWDVFAKTKVSNSGWILHFYFVGRYDKRGEAVLAVVSKCGIPQRPQTCKERSTGSGIQ